MSNFINEEYALQATQEEFIRQQANDELIDFPMSEVSLEDMATFC